MRVIYAKACVERKPEYRQQTLILEDGGERFARKIAIGDAAKEHIRDYGRNARRLSDAAKPDGRVKAVPCRENEDGSVNFPFCSEPVFSEILAGKMAEEYIRLVQELKDALTETYGTCPFEETEGFEDFFGIRGDFAGEESLKITNADLNFDNIFCGKTGGDAERLSYTVIDYEWILPFPIPLSFLLYRAFLLDPAFNRFSGEDREKIFRHFGIREENIPVFRSMEAGFLNNISPDSVKLDYYARTETPMLRRQIPFKELIRLPEENRKLEAELADYREKAGTLWFRVFRKMENAKKKAKEKIRQTAKKKSFIGRVFSYMICLFKEGPRATVRKFADFLQKGKVAAAFANREIDSAVREQEEHTVFPKKILFSILVPLYNTPRDFLVEMIRSVQDQTYRNWELCLADGSDDAHGWVGETCREMAKDDPRIRYRHLGGNFGISGNTNACIDMAGGDYIVLFDHDDLLHPSALYENMKAICEQDADFIYSDETVFISPELDNVLAIHFKPDFAPDSLLANNYICHLSVFRRELLEQTGGFRDICNGSQDHDLILRLTGCAERIVHIPKVLYFWRSHPTSVASDISAKTYAINAGRFAVKDYLQTHEKISATVVSTEAYPTMYHVKYPIKGHPRVGIIADLSDEAYPEEKAREMIAAIEKNTDDAAVTITMVARKDFMPEGVTRFPVLWIPSDRDSRPARLNRAVRETDAEYIVFLNEELLPRNADWLQEMLMLAQWERIGAVGAKAVFDNLRLRYGGLILGLGKHHLVGRSHYRVARDNSGYFGQLAIAENVSAVSAECMMISRAKFEEAGGFSEEYADTLFDVDLCLKLREKGYDLVYTPFAELQGGKSRKYSMDYGTESTFYRQDAAVLRENWQDVLAKPDPFYNPNLSLDDPDYHVRT